MNRTIKSQQKRKRKIINEVKAVFPSKSVNESLARMIIAALCCQLDPTIDELADIKTAVSEAVTNCIVHGYENKSDGEIKLTARYFDNNIIQVSIKDKGKGIEDVKKAMQPMFTTDTSGERSGMGFSIMKSFMDKISVKSLPGKGATVTFEKKIQIHK
jgi:stage II sporulation protein AB (anti-sigma F factor)